MAGTNIQSTISIDIKAGAQLTGDAKAEFDALNKSLLTTGLTTKQLEDILLKIKAILDADSESTNNLAAATNTLSEGMASMGQSAQVAADATGELKNSITAVNGAIAGGGSGGGSSSGGGLLDSLSKQRIAFTDIGRLVTGQGLSLRNLTSNFALFGPQVVIGAAAIGYFGEQLIKYINSTDTADTATQKINASITKNLSDEIGQVQVLAATIEDSNTSQKERKDAIQQLIDQHPNYFKNLQDEDGVTKNLTTDTEKFTKAIEEEARIKAISTQVSKLVAEQLQAEADAQDKIAFLTKQAASDRESNNQDAIDLDNKETALTKSNTAEKVAEIQKQIDIYTKLGVASEQSLSGLGGGTGKQTPKTDNSLKEQANYIAESQKILEDAQQKEITDENIKYDKIKADLIKNGHDTETLTEQHQKNLLNIDVKYENLRATEIAKIEADQAKKAQEAQASDLKQLLQIQNEFAATAQKNSESTQANEIDNLTAKFNKAKELTMLYGGDLIALTIQYNSAVDAVNKKYDDAAVAEQNRQDSAILQRGDRAANSILGQKISQYANQKKALDTFQSQLDEFYTEGIISDQDYTNLTNQNATARNEIRLKEISNYAGYADQIGQALTKVGSALGEQTQAGKDVAIAGTIISTLAGAVKAYESQAEIPVIGPALGIAAAAAALAAGYENVKKIEQTQIPGQSGGSSGASANLGNAAGGSLALSAPQIPSATNSTNLSAQSIQQIQQVNSQAAPIRAVVVESDLTGTQNRVAGYQSANTLGGSTRH